jgi:hypothetical protein
MELSTINSYFSPQTCIRAEQGEYGPNTYHTHFLEHLLPCISNKDNQKCPICWATFGSLYRDTRLSDLPVKVCKIPGYQHKFGRKCMKQVFRSLRPGHKSCPLCMTQWFRTAMNPVHLYLEGVDLGDPSWAGRVARLYDTDIATTRDVLQAVQTETTPDITHIRVARLREDIQYTTFIGMVFFLVPYDSRETH